MDTTSAEKQEESRVMRSQVGARNRLSLAALLALPDKLAGHRVR